MKYFDKDESECYIFYKLQFSLLMNKLLGIVIPISCFFYLLKQKFSVSKNLSKNFDAPDSSILYIWLRNIH